MPATIPTSEPTELTAGDSWQWDRTYGDYPSSDGWSLTYALTGSGAAPVEIVASAASGVSFEVRVAAATTASYAAGRHDLIGYVSKGGERFQVYKGALVVLPDPAVATIALSFNERMLAQLETKIAERLSADISSYTLEQQEVHREELRLLEGRRNAYAEAVRIERGGSATRTMQVRFD